jgi:hypothetical protein
MNAQTGKSAHSIISHFLIGEGRGNIAQAARTKAVCPEQYWAIDSLIIVQTLRHVVGVP